ncbi:DUF1292 domain-containing protein [Anaerotalea alkaliphila]|uniref:DUF1292 domain-containing protein n=1 Tax=Anaerotalea alkaliphila TaxID=2662126 RepID=A0A7X5KNT8_9FIRM|nr:DUF1292 domain-containing protein [Anaerotalea alkaliphila]NDL68148.1 DUF1292 domain-containing protein [Anaerotalea alkaliphila]
MAEDKIHGCGCGDDDCTDEGCDCGDAGCSDEGCGCGHDHDHPYQKISLTLDDDTTEECSVLGIFDVEEQSYIALLPDNSDNVLLYRYSEEESTPNLENIESDAEFELVSSTFLSLIEEEGDEEYEEDEEV